MPNTQEGCNGNIVLNEVYNGEITNRLWITGKKLIKIKGSSDISGEVLFTSNFSHPEISSKKLISNIAVKDKDLNTIETFDFNYLSTNNDRAFLKDISFLNPDKSYEFQYIDTEGVPLRLSKSQDYWGYYNGINNNTYRFPNPQGSYINKFLPSSFSPINLGANKEVNPLFAEKGCLTR